MDVERERLATLYKGYTDAQLLDLAGDEANLTDAAQTALTAELVGRGLEGQPASEELESGFGPGIPGIFPSSAAVMEKALEPGGETAFGQAELVSLFDGHELTRACEALESGKVDLEIRQREGNALTGTPPWFEIWVAEADVTRSQEILREKLGLFPLAEITTSQPAEDDGSMVVLGDFETREEAEAVASTLTENSISSRVDRTSTTPDTAEASASWFSVHVAASDLDRGLDVVAKSLDLDLS